MIEIGPNLTMILYGVLFVIILHFFIKAMS